MQIYLHALAYIKLDNAWCLMPLLFLCIHQILFYNHCSFQVSSHTQLKLVCKAWVCNYIPQYSVGCTYLSCFHDWKWMVLLTFVIMLFLVLTHWGWATHISISKLSIICSDNVLLSGQRQAIIWTNDEILLIHPLGTNFKMHLKMSSAKCCLFCLRLNVLNTHNVHAIPSSCWRVRYEWGLEKYFTGISFPSLSKYMNQ